MILFVGNLKSALAMDIAIFVYCHLVMPLCETLGVCGDLRARLDDKAMRFLLSLHDTEPDFDAIGLPHAAALPAVRWKLINLAKLKQQNPDKHAMQRAEIENVFA